MFPAYPPSVLPPAQLFLDVFDSESDYGEDDYDTVDMSDWLSGSCCLLYYTHSLDMRDLLLPSNLYKPRWTLDLI